MATFDDYLLRQIHRFTQALIDAISAREAGDVAGANDAIDRGLRGLVGLSVDRLARLAPSAIEPLVSNAEGLEVDRAVAVGLLLAESALLQSDPGVAHQHRVAAVGLLALCADGGPLDPALVERLDELVRSVHLTALHPLTLQALARWFEVRDRFDRAEDSLFAWLQREPDAAHAATMAFYERLWGLPDARLKAGGLSSQEVLDGLAELQASGRG